MKSIHAALFTVFSGCLFFSSAALAANLAWQEIEIGENVRLRQAIALVAKEGSPIRLPKGERMTMADLEPLEASVLKATFRRDDCADAELESELELVLPEGAADRAEVGVQLETECRFAVFIETKDYGTVSFFE